MTAMMRVAQGRNAIWVDAVRSALMSRDQGKWCTKAVNARSCEGDCGLGPVSIIVVCLIAGVFLRSPHFFVAQKQKQQVPTALPHDFALQNLPARGTKKV